MNQDTWWWRLVHLEPALVRMAVMAVVGLLGAFGILVAPAAVDSVIGFVMVTLLVIQWVITRPTVTANARVVVLAPDPINQPTIVTAGAAETSATNGDIIDAARDIPRG
jgi:hypothetical protein